MAAAEKKSKRHLFIVGGVSFETTSNQTSLQMAEAFRDNYWIVWYIAKESRTKSHSPDAIKRKKRILHLAYTTIDGINVVHLPQILSGMPLSRPSLWRSILVRLLAYELKLFIDRNKINDASAIFYWWFFPELTAIFPKGAMFDLIDRHWDSKSTGKSVRVQEYHKTLAVETALKVNTTVTVSPGLSDEMASEGVDSHVIANGFRRMEAEILDLDQPRSQTAIYVGGVNARVDCHLLRRVATENRDWIFLIAGTGDALHLLEGIDNLILLGDCPHALVLKAICHCRVGLIPFSESKFVSSSNLMKLYDYLIANVEILSTDAVDFNHLPEDARLRIHVAAPDEWTETLRRVGNSKHRTPIDLSDHTTDKRAEQLASALARGERRV